VILSFRWWGIEKVSRLVITVKDIIGNCYVHTAGEKIEISGPKIDLECTDNICIHALAPILHYAVALREGVDPVKLGLAKEGKCAYVNCPDCGEPYTYGGRVVFEIKRLED
jgi:uncharacterized repeat protein (TIGR04076 family)